MFPLIGHAHPSFFRNADVTARLDVRPWPRAARWIAHGVRTGRWSANRPRYGGGSGGAGGEYSLANIDWDTIEARVAAWVESRG